MNNDFFDPYNAQSTSGRQNSTMMVVSDLSLDPHNIWGMDAIFPIRRIPEAEVNDPNTPFHERLLQPRQNVRTTNQNHHRGSEFEPKKEENPSFWNMANRQSSSTRNPPQIIKVLENMEAYEIEKQPEIIHKTSIYKLPTLKKEVPELRNVPPMSFQEVYAKALEKMKKDEEASLKKEEKTEW